MKRLCQYPPKMPLIHNFYPQPPIDWVAGGAYNYFMTHKKSKPSERVSEPVLVLDKQIRWTYCRQIAEHFYWSKLSTPEIKIFLEDWINNSKNK